MTAHECFVKAEENYQLIRSLVGQMGEDVKESMPSFDVSSAYCQLDILVQYVLLREAIADGHFSVEEGKFIDSLTTSYDIIKLFNNVPDGLNWSWLASNCSLKKIESVVGEVEKLAMVHMQYFTDIFAVLDAITVDDLLGLIIEGIGHIVTCFALVDGNKENVEIVAARETVKKYLATPWLALMKKVRGSHIDND